MVNTKQPILEEFTDIVGPFAKLDNYDDYSAVITLGHRRARVPVHIFALIASMNIRQGDLISVIRTDNETDPLRIVRLPDGNLESQRRS